MPWTMTRPFLVSLVLCVALGCSQSKEPVAPAVPLAPGSADLPTPEQFAEQFPEFAKYWHQGKAELTRYTLRQSRYGDSHDGDLKAN